MELYSIRKRGVSSGTLYVIILEKIHKLNPESVTFMARNSCFAVFTQKIRVQESVKIPPVPHRSFNDAPIFDTISV